MKKYTFSFDNNNTTRSNNITIPSTNYSEIIDDIIRTNIKKNNPYLFGGTIDNDYYSDIIITPSTKKTIDINITLPKKKTIIIDTTKSTDSFSEFMKALKFISNFNFEKDDYDFKLDDGTPIKIFADEIQIGYDLIPLNGLTKSIYDALSESAKKSIIDIYIEIKK